MMEEKIWLAHYGVKGMHWGIRKSPKYTPKTVFVSGSSKTQFKDNPYYRKQLPKEVRRELDSHMRKGDKIIVGDAPGIDRQTQDYLKSRRYKNVEVYSPGNKSRYLANKKWKNILVDSSEFKEDSPEWLAKKDKVMSNIADKGIAVILDEGSKATRRNIDRLIDANKDVSVYQLNKGTKKVTSNYLFDPFKAMDRIDNSLSKKEKDYVGVGNNKHSTDDIKFFFNKDRTAYLITADYHGKYKDEHPVSGKIIGIAAMKQARGTGDTDKLIKNAKKEFKNERLVAEIDSSNVASRKLFERNGFKKIKTLYDIDYYVYESKKVNDYDLRRNNHKTFHG